jgi:hypothetical protein
VAAVINYLNYAKDLIEKDPRYIKMPSKHLKSILVNLENSNVANEPKYVRNTKSKFIHQEIESVNTDSGTLITFFLLFGY